MDIGMRHLHVTVVVILLLFVLFKTILLVANRIELLDRIRAKTKVVDIILGILVLATGIFLTTLKQSVEPYLWTKIILVLVSIPIGIIGLKSRNKLLAILSVILIIYVYGIGETHSYKFKRDPIVINNNEHAGQEIYQILCNECHGDDGRKGLFKAPDLTKSVLDQTEMRSRILHGKGIMRGYEGELNDEQVDAVIEYITSLP
jgi:cytochrome c5